jgi:alpha-glucosidase (family GH31 glycosyl hydrolase)
MARANGIDPATKNTVEFDFTDMSFVKSYFDILHHPYENDGVDFWWIDWQQGKKSKLKGFDPLWALNHYHTLDSARDGRKPLILSRYAGVGSHRYPLGFSGDTFVKWASLKLQPYFTATASNIGYTWWSHDIGGHIFGNGDSELYTRWVQYGVFSPINRLHSNNTALSKEPWLYSASAETIATGFLRLRHRLLPYLYTANIRTARDGEPLTMPMYYIDKSAEAYKAKNQYYFGSELLVSPVVEKCKNDGFAYVKVYLPKGRWTDFFTGKVYIGGQVHTMATPLNRMPVFAKEGAIIPMLKTRNGNSTDFDELEVRVYPGNNKYRMFDEGGYTDFEVCEVDEGYAVKIDDEFAPVKAEITVEFVGDKTQKVLLKKGQKEIFFKR